MSGEAGMSGKWAESPDAVLARRLGKEPSADPRPEMFHGLPWFFGLFAGEFQGIGPDGPVTITFQPPDGPVGNQP